MIKNSAPNVIETLKATEIPPRRFDVSGSHQRDSIIARQLAEIERIAICRLAGLIGAVWGSVTRTTCRSSLEETSGGGVGRCCVGICVRRHHRDESVAGVKLANLAIAYVSSRQRWLL